MPEPLSSMCVGCEEKPAVEDGLCEGCASWCKDFFTKLFPADDEDEHFPWSYTEYGVLCVCGSAMDADENCLGHRNV